MELSIYSVLADSPHWRIHRHEHGMSTEPIFTTRTERDLSLEDIFRAFNRVTDADAMFLDAMGYTLPSLSVGDVVTIDGKHHMVASCGFTALSCADFAAYRAMSDIERMMKRRSMM